MSDGGRFDSAGTASAPRADQECGHVGGAASPVPSRFDVWLGCGVRASCPIGRPTAPSRCRRQKRDAVVCGPLPLNRPQPHQPTTNVLTGSLPAELRIYRLGDLARRVSAHRHVGYQMIFGHGVRLHEAAIEQVRAAVLALGHSGSSAS